MIQITWRSRPGAHVRSVSTASEPRRATLIRRHLPLAVLIVSIPASAAAQPVAGRVLLASGEPAEGAIVTVNHGERVTAGADGRFSLEVARDPLGDVIVASRTGAVSTTLDLEATAASDALELVLTELPEDDTAFAPVSYGECTLCHHTYGGGWGGTGGYRGTAHARAATNPTVLDVFLGTASGRTDEASCTSAGGSWERVIGPDGAGADRCYVGIGYLADINPQCGHEGQPRCDDRGAPAEAAPTEYGDCAGCHTPGAAMSLPANLDLLSAAADPNRTSVTCAVCHRIAEVFDPNLPGILVGARMTRAPDLLSPLALGPMPDPEARGMRAVYSPLHADSLLCAPCHQDTASPEGMAPRWAPAGVPSEQTYQEWAEWPEGGGITCQNCHMPSLRARGIETSFPHLAGGAPERSTSDIHLHDFSPLLDGASLAEAIGVRLQARLEGDAIVVDVEVENVDVGHGFPSGVTSRNAILLVSAMRGDDALPAVGGEVVPTYGGALQSGTVVAQDRIWITLDGDAPPAAAGATLRAWRDGTTFRPHRSFGILRALSDEEKGLRATEAVGQWTIVGADGPVVEVSLPRGETALPDLTGARFAIGDRRGIAGEPGTGFAKVTLAADGTENVPFWRATDLRWDNRLAPGEIQATSHRFALVPGDADVVISATLLYRKTFPGLAEQRGWAFEDLEVRKVSTTIRMSPDDAGPGADAGVTRPPEGCGCHAPGAASRWPAPTLLLALAAAWLLTRRRAGVAPRRRCAASGASRSPEPPPD